MKGQPLGQDIDLSKFAEMGNDLIPRLNSLREQDPLYWSKTSKCWIATGHSFVVEGLSGKLPLSAKRHQIIESFFPDPVERAQKIGYIVEVFPDFLTNTDPPEQARLRKLLMLAFSKQVAESYRPYVRTVVAEVMDSLADRTTVDFVGEVARRITAKVILHVMGLPEDHLAQTEHWAQTLNAGLSGNPNPVAMAAANDAMVEMRDVFEKEIERREGKAPTNDFVSLLLAARDGSDQLTRSELIAQLILVLVAGHDTTLNTMALSVAKLADMPEERTIMRDNPDKFEACIMELMRVVAMSTSMRRVVSEDFEWQGRHLQRGQVIFLMLAAANRDPAVFSRPEQIDFDRNQAGNMTFAPGRHFCIGHWFAKMMMSEALPAFLARYESWDVLEDDLLFTASVGFRGPVRVNLRLHPRLAA
ncbi:cytochrome P450 [Sphingobium sp. JS3065]|uniref:cytochrome P450 n=1 Tax=Sphingobium sp. JS3065 TaxID=2970925 RepID=UPI0022656D6C|nr:cytochrome P450 [Sphingobium sp. JS3065]UZW53689.1 cytochrome P450 [Sphingobium sp. JS3065]